MRSNYQRVCRAVECCDACYRFTSLTELARNPDAAVAITVSPQTPPDVIFGRNVFEVDDDGASRLVEPALRIVLPNLWLDLHVFMDDRWVRILSISVDLDVPIGIDFAPDNSIIPMIGDLSEAIQNVRTENADILLDDPEVVATLLPSLAAGLLGDMAGGLIDPIAIPEFFGLTLDLSEGAVTALDEGALLALFARFARAMPIDGELANGETDEAAETNAGDYEVRLPSTEMFSLPQTDTWKQIEIIVDVEASLPSGRNAPMEVSWRANHGTWSPFHPVGRVTVSHPDFVLQGRHVIEMRARESGRYSSLDPSPVVFVVLIDCVSPDIEVIPGPTDRIRLVPKDRLTETDNIRLDVQSLNGRWRPLGHGIQAVRRPDIRAVRATDDAGNQTVIQLTTDKRPLIGRLPPAERTAMGSGGCDVIFKSHSLTHGIHSFWSLFCLITPAKPPCGRSIRRAHWLVLLVGCDDDSSARGDGDGTTDAGMGRCMDASDCPSSNFVCTSGECKLVNCRGDRGACESLSCADGDAMCNDRGACECVPFCDGGCETDTYCCLATGLCEPEPDACIALSCSEGERAIRTLAEEGDPNLCGDEKFRCECETLPDSPWETWGASVI